MYLLVPRLRYRTFLDAVNLEGVRLELRALRFDPIADEYSRSAIFTSIVLAILTTTTFKDDFLRVAWIMRDLFIFTAEKRFIVASVVVPIMALENGGSGRAIFDYIKKPLMGRTLLKIANREEILRRRWLFVSFGPSRKWKPPGPFGDLGY